MMSVSMILKKMIEYSDGNMNDIEHFVKVWGYAKCIGESEGLDKSTQYILEVTAIIHDIACPLCREKYGNTSGKLQEKESEPLIREFLSNSDIDENMIERIIYLVCHHHTYSNVDGLDYQILLEADYLVNAYESGYGRENIIHMYDTVFKTGTGRALLSSMYKL